MGGETRREVSTKYESNSPLQLARYSRQNNRYRSRGGGTLEGLFPRGALLAISEPHLVVAVVGAAP